MERVCGVLAPKDGYEEGEKLDQDPAEMVKWYGLAAAQGHTEAEYRLGLCCYYGIGMEKDPAKAAEWFRRAAEKQHAGAEVGLGYAYFYGSGPSLGPNIF